MMPQGKTLPTNTAQKSRVYDEEPMRGSGNMGGQSQHLVSEHWFYVGLRTGPGGVGSWARGSEAPLPSPVKESPQHTEGLGHPRFLPVGRNDGVALAKKAKGL